MQVLLVLGPAEDEVHRLLNNVDEEEAEADEQLGETLQLYLLRGLGEGLPCLHNAACDWSVYIMLACDWSDYIILANKIFLTCLREDVEHGDGQHDATTEAEENASDNLTRPRLDPLHAQAPPAKIRDK